jgi:hypothetical protein
MLISLAAGRDPPVLADYGRAGFRREAAGRTESRVAVDDEGRGVAAAATTDDGDIFVEPSA